MSRLKSSRLRWMGMRLCSRCQRPAGPTLWALLTSLRCAVWIPCCGTLGNVYRSFGIFAIHSRRFSVHRSEKEGPRKHPSQMELTVSCIARLGKDSRELVGKCWVPRMSFWRIYFPSLLTQRSLSHNLLLPSAADLLDWTVCLGQRRQLWVPITVISN